VAASGTFTVREEASWAGPDLTMETGTFTASEGAAWAGPDMTLEAGQFAAAEAALWAGPDMTAEGGQFTAREEALWFGPDLTMEGGTFSVGEEASWSGPDLTMGAGTFTSTVLTIVDWSGPDMTLEGGTFSVREEALWAGPDLTMGGGTFTVSEEASWAGPDMTLEGGTFTYLTTITADWAGPDLTMGGGTFTFAKTDEFYLGTQYVEGALNFSGPTDIELYGAVFDRAGDYVIFDYSDGSFADGQADLDAHVTVINVDLPPAVELPASSGITVLENQSLRQRVILHLASSPTNGKQWVEGDLDFDGPVTAVLAEEVYVTRGTYELFQVSGTVTGLANLTCVSPRGYTCTVSQVGNIIYVTLA